MGEHGGEEIVYVLEGTFVDQYRSSGPGTVIRGEPGSSHPTAMITESAPAPTCRTQLSGR
jgi:hypothetical protein